MIRLRRKLLIDTALLGAGLTMVAVLLSVGGLLDSLENWAYDRRARLCQSFATRPTTQLVHLDIDDNSTHAGSVGRFPWPRARFAEILNELSLAKPKAVALDITFNAPTDDSRVGSGTTRPVSTDDAEFAAALKNLGNAILPEDLNLVDPASISPATKAVLEALVANPALEREDLAKALAANGSPTTGVAEDVFFDSRRQAVFERILRMSGTGLPPVADVRAALIPASSSELDVASPLSRVIDEQYARASATLTIARLAPPSPAPAAPFITSVGDLLSPPITPFGQTSVATGFVNIGFFTDGTVRSLPLAIEVRGRLYPQFGLALACRMLDIDPARLRYAENSVIIPGTDGMDVVIPTHSQHSAATGSDVKQVMDIPWFGKSHWQSMYDYPSHTVPAQHVPISLLWDVHLSREKIARHNAMLDDAIISLLSSVKSRAKAVEYATARPAPEDIATRVSVAEGLLPDVKEMLELTDPSEKSEANQKFLIAARVIPSQVRQAKLLDAQLLSQRAQLANLLGGKAVLVGWTATSAIADFVPTSLHTKCPGVVVHGAIFNAIMTRHFWRRAPQWVTIAVTVVLGLMTAFAASTLSPGRAAGVASLLLAAYLLMNGFLFFDYARIIVGVSAPMVAIAMVWSGCTLVRVIVEGRERAFISRRFSTYADPMLVDYIVEHPEKVQFDGERKELTVVFTDLQGFTTISERLGEKSVLLLNEYMGMMVPIIRRNLGYVNKFLGDGIMFFFGAPYENKDHAAVALKTVLEMQEAMTPFNDRLAAAGLPLLIMRAGVSTGEMVVGDAGSKDRSDYTVLGDAVNLGARLESGNKAIGTKMLASGRARELGGAGLLLRPVGSFCYLGKSEGIATYEVVGRAAEALPAQLRLAELSQEMVDAFKAAKFEDCLAVIGRIEGEFSPGNLTRLYRQLAEKYLSEGPPVGFCGNIVLTEK